MFFLSEPLTLNSTVKAVTAEVTNGIVMRTKDIIRTDTRPYGVKNETQEERAVSSVTCLFYTLFSATMALQYMQGMFEGVFNVIYLHGFFTLPSYLVS